MSNLDIIRAWKDEEYRMGLSEEQRKLLPEHPAGLLELTDADLDAAAGGLPKPTAPGICTSACTQLGHYCPTQWLGNTCRYCTYTDSCQS
jgi:mersacidin/lichenicidin family type 2 lantibiotic